jgi:hypothetical protein
VTFFLCAASSRIVRHFPTCAINLNQIVISALIILFIYEAKRGRGRWESFFLFIRRISSSFINNLTGSLFSFPKNFLGLKDSWSFMDCSIMEMDDWQSGRSFCSFITPLQSLIKWFQRPRSIFLFSLRFSYAINLLNQEAFFFFRFLNGKYTKMKLFDPIHNF